MEMELQMLNIAADFAENASQAFSFLKQVKYDIIFLDVVLPDVDGYKICKAIKKEKEIKDTPVLMLTGKSSPFDRVRGKFSGCNDYLTKPTQSATFQKAVKKYLPVQIDPNGTDYQTHLTDREELARLADSS